MQNGILTRLHVLPRSLVFPRSHIICGNAFREVPPLQYGRQIICGGKSTLKVGRFTASVLIISVQPDIILPHPP